MEANFSLNKIHEEGKGKLIDDDKSFVQGLLYQKSHKILL